MAEIAVAWLWSWRGVTAGYRPGSIAEHVDGWINSPLRKLTPTDLDEIAEALLTTSAGSGPVKEAQ